MIQALIEDNLEEPNCSFTQAADKVAINRLTKKWICKKMDQKNGAERYIEPRLGCSSDSTIVNWHSTINRKMTVFFVLHLCSMDVVSL
jgi:hypothetical protein